MAISPSKISVVAALAIVLTGSAGCMSSSDDSMAGKGGGGAGGNPATPTKLAFDPATTLTMVPGDMRELSLDATPAAVYHVRFALLGDYKDDSLDKSEVDTDAKGHASVAITAPTAATTF